MVYFPISPVQCTYLTLRNVSNLKFSKLLVKEHLLENKQVHYTLSVHYSFFAVMIK